MALNLDPKKYPEHPDKAPTSKIVQLFSGSMGDLVLCEDGSVWELKNFNPVDNQWKRRIEPFQKQYEFYK